MALSNNLDLLISQPYFRGFHDLRDYCTKDNWNTKKLETICRVALAIFKILSYFTIIIPAAIAIIYLLKGRAKAPPKPTVILPPIPVVVEPIKPIVVPPEVKVEEPIEPIVVPPEVKVEEPSTEDIQEYIKDIKSEGSVTAATYQPHALSLIKDRITPKFAAVTLAHANELIEIEQFWILVDKFPDVAAELFSADVIKILASKKDERRPELIKIIGKFPNDDKLKSKLLAMAEYATRSQVHDYPTDSNGKCCTETEVGTLDAITQRAFSLKTDKKEIMDKAKGAAGLKLDAIKHHKSKAKELIEKRQTPKVERKFKHEVTSAQDYNNKVYADSQNAPAQYCTDEECKDPLFVKNDTILNRMTEKQLENFVRTLGKAEIDKLWTIESAPWTKESAMIKPMRLKNILAFMSDKQFDHTIICEKFYVTLDAYPEAIANALTTEQWEIIVDQLCKDLQFIDDPIYSNTQLIKIPLGRLSTALMAIGNVFVKYVIEQENQAAKKRDLEKLSEIAETLKKLIIQFDVSNNSSIKDLGKKLVNTIKFKLFH